MLLPATTRKGTEEVAVISTAGDAVAQFGAGLEAEGAAEEMTEEMTEEEMAAARKLMKENSVKMLSSLVHRLR
jgi:hypothetical protein